MIVVSFALSVFVPVFASAQTTSTTSPTAIVGQIQALQTQINALQQQQQQNIATLVMTLRQGSSGDQVLILQALLAADPSLYPEGIVSGFFGRLTADAVKRFQKKNGIEQAGVVGPKTLKKLQEYLKKNPLAFSMATSTATSTSNRGGKNEDRRPCAIIPPGHLIAPGWLKKNKGDGKQIVSECENRSGKNDDDDDDDDDDRPRGTKTPTPTPVPTSTSTPTPTPSPTPVPDTTAPIISAVNVTNIASTTVTLSWQTNEAATSKIYYATTTPVILGSALTVSNNSLVTNHSLNLSGLIASTTYRYVLESKDAIGNTTTTTPSTQNFTTAN